MDMLLKELGPPKAASGGKEPLAAEGTEGGADGTGGSAHLTDIGHLHPTRGGGGSATDPVLQGVGLTTILLMAVVVLLTLLLLSSWSQISAIKQLDWTLRQSMLEASPQCQPQPPVSSTDSLDG